MADLSVLIPARNELFLRQTIEDVLAHATADTEVIAVCDGAWPLEAIPDHPRVTLTRTGTPIGQRAAVNLAARLATGRYVMKLDAHCAVAPGFDTQLVADGDALGADVTQVPRLFNLAAFDWQCGACGARTYQGPTPTVCASCKAAASFTRVMVWQPRKNRMTDFMRFDETLHFAYWGAYKNRPEAQGEIVDLMSFLGAFWVMRRERYWQLGGCDEAHGGWGQCGTEWACKSWLSGGRLVANKRTWVSHMFRSSGGDFGFPYPLSGREVEKARAHSRRLWLENTWPGQTRPLSWLLDKFWPVPGWSDEARATVTAAGARFSAGHVATPVIRVAAPTVAPVPVASEAPHAPTAGLVYYSDCRLDPAIDRAVRAQLRRCVNGHRLVSVTLAPVDLGENVVLPLARGVLTMFRQILAGLEALDTELAFLVEHDCLYPPSGHFDFVPPRSDWVYYNQHVWKVHAETGHALTYRSCNQASGLCAHRQLLVEHYKRRIARVEREGRYRREMGYEPGTRKMRHGGIDDLRHGSWMSAVPILDLRHQHNLTANRWSIAEFRNQKWAEGWTEAEAVPGWGVTGGRMAAFLAERTKD